MVPCDTQTVYRLLQIRLFVLTVPEGEPKSIVLVIILIAPLYGDGGDVGMELRPRSLLGFALATIQCPAYRVIMMSPAFIPGYLKRSAQAGKMSDGS